MVLRTLHQALHHLSNLWVRRLIQHSPQVSNVHLLDSSSNHQCIQRTTGATRDKRVIKALVLREDENAWNIVQSAPSTSTNQSLNGLHVLTLSARNVSENG
jgi:hypothetical protein